MDNIQVFQLDGVSYNVSVTSLTRKFSVMDTDKSGRTQNGQMYRDIIGTFYNYTMTIQERNGDAASLESFWAVMVVSFYFGTQHEKTGNAGN